MIINYLDNTPFKNKNALNILSQNTIFEKTHSYHRIND